MNIKRLLRLMFWIGSVLLLAFRNPGPIQDPWKAPDWTDGLKPIGKQSPSILAEGKALYTSYCLACHGVNGKGEGALGAGFPIKPANFQTHAVKSQKDGAIFWKLSEGRGNMPSYKATLSDEQRWQLVAYIRELSGGIPAQPHKYEHLLPANNYVIPSGLSSPYLPLPPKVSNAVGSEELVFMVDTVVSGLTRPWSMVFLPDNRILIAERAGNLRVVKDGALQATSIIGNVPVGLRDLKLHPRFMENRRIYLSYYIEPLNGSGGYTVLMSGRLEGDKMVDEKVLYKAGPFKEGGETYGSRIAFDKAGFLYFTVGQRTIDDRHRWKTVQDKTNPSGKVMRFNDDGSIPADNPFVDSLGVLKEIFTYGHRQPQGLITHPQTGEIWESEHGEMGGSELNLLKKGSNYGWPDVTFSRNYDGTYISKDTVRAGMESPVHHWTPSIAPSNFDFIYGDLYPGWNNNLFIGAMVLKHLTRTVFQHGMPVHNETLLENIGRIRDVKVGPDRFLYLMIEDTGQVIRLIPLKKAGSDN
jgi:glucose/arabinose dehydrogenase/mono/diheme cytochrome c family protein